MRTIAIDRRDASGGASNSRTAPGSRPGAHPVIVNGKLYLRDQDVLLCYDVKAK